MNVRNRSSSSTRLEDSPPAVRWRSWPMVDSPLWTLIVLVGLVAVWLGVQQQTDSPQLASLSAGAIVLAMWKFFLPVTYELNGQGVHRWILGRHRRVLWATILAHQTCSSGVLLLPCADASPIDALRGLFVPWGAHRDEVARLIAYHLGPQNGRIAENRIE
jgi:hypothetical protein